MAPNEISYIDETVWNDIYKSQSRGSEDQLPKALPAKGHRNRAGPALFNQPSDKIHHELRKTLSAVMSDRGIRERESMLRKYVSLLISRLRDQNSSAINITTWLEAITADIMGCMLNKDQDFGSLIRGAALPVISQNYKMIIRLAIGTIFSKNFFTRNFLVKRKNVPQYLPIELVVKERWDRAMALKSSQSARNDLKDDSKADLFSLLSSNHSHPLDLRLRVFSDILIAGSDTVPMSLSGILYLLMRNPSKFKQLQDEIRSTFTSAEEITLTGVNALKFQSAVIVEGYRLWPPPAETFRRVVRKGGKIILCQWIPAGTWVGVYHWAAGHWSGAWKDHDKFLPERWLPENQGENGEYRDDKRGVIQPFNVGPRNCVGQQLANAATRLILANLVWHFDIELAEETRDDAEDWMNVKIFGLVYVRKPLMVRLKYIR